MRISTALPRSPGINDNGSGVAALLETASALGAQPEITNAVRFVVLGVRGSRLEGRRNMLADWTATNCDDIALYLELRRARLAERRVLHL